MPKQVSTRHTRFRSKSYIPNSANVSKQIGLSFSSACSAIETIALITPIGMYFIPSGISINKRTSFKVCSLSSLNVRGSLDSDLREIHISFIGYSTKRRSISVHLPHYKNIAMKIYYLLYSTRINYQISKGTVSRNSHFLCRV